ncbi:Modifier of mdg4 [Operophtera brumata]|uniref:Modifier of mdg4 n=1 Tax=Operophtera brumata TaxID=104452 RepID=A0A0L7KP35_OPEBR|nr:Modifier of mdg4 [Operophtera brumata]
MSGYRFNKHRVMGCKIHWQCSAHWSRGCRAVLHTLEDMVTIIKYIVVTTSQKGRQLLLVSGYRFNRQGGRRSKMYWKCSTHMQRGCRAVIHTLEDMTIVKCMNVHNH